MNERAGFTIVELLIVVVVIAILAAITIISFNGIQQRANNTAINDAASKSKRMIEAYIAQTSQYPYTVDDDFACITTDTGCRRNSSLMVPISAFTTNVSTVGALPKSAPMATDTRGGITYAYNAARTVGGVSAPAIISWYIRGVNSDCGMPVLQVESALAANISVNKFTTGNIGSSGATQCVASISGPGV